MNGADSLAFKVAELVAVVASGTYGAILARQHRMDFIGVFSVGFIGAFGGGTLRDLILDRHPMFWIREEHYPVIVFGIALAVSLTRSVPRWMDKILVAADALGLGLFSVVGATAAIEFGTSAFIASLLGVVTGTFGGVIGDIVCNKVPSLFSTTPLFATCSFTGCWLLFLLESTTIPDYMAIIAAITFIVAFRLAAIRFQWRLPHHNHGESSN